MEACFATPFNSASAATRGSVLSSSSSSLAAAAKCGVDAEAGAEARARLESFVGEDLVGEVEEDEGWWW